MYILKIFNLFKAYGSIKSAKVRRLKTGLVEKPLGCGFVDFENPEEAERARQALNNYTLSSEFGSRVISVTYADCKNSRIRMKLDKEKQEIYLDESSENLNIDKYLYKNLSSPSQSNAVLDSPLSKLLPDNFGVAMTSRPAIKVMNIAVIEPL